MNDNNNSCILVGLGLQKQLCKVLNIVCAQQIITAALMCDPSKICSKACYTHVTDVECEAQGGKEIRPCSCSR